MRTEAEVRREILDRVAELWRIRASGQEFIPGRTKVNYAGRVFDDKELVALVDASLDSWLTLAGNAVAFERRLAEYLGVGKVLVTNSGSSANLLAVAALCAREFPERLEAGDEVITTAVTFPTTLAPIIQYNLVPVFVDVERDTYNIDPAALEAAVSPRTRAIVLAHTLGNPADMDAIMSVARKYRLHVIEDTCDALDSRYDGRMVGTFGDMGTISFYAAHHITMGEGGAVVTDNPSLHKILLSLRDWGRACFCQTGEAKPNGACNNRFGFKFEGLPAGYDHKYVYTNIGYNLKPLDVQCAVGLVQLAKLPEFTRRRRQNFRALYETFAKYEDKFILPRALPKAEPSWFAIPITVKQDAGFTKNDMVEFLESKRIETRMLFAGNILRQPGYRHIKKRVLGDLRHTDNIMQNTFFLGVYPGITPERLAYMSETIDEFMAGHARG
ncbi:MAG: lipopolysaccharide biosynthesis protein RfbH [Bacteroidota bacterium]